MADGYTETPYNMAEIIPCVIMEREAIVKEILIRQKCYFYDTCSFRWHANLTEDDAAYILKYIKEQDGIVIITRCILMELASHSGILQPEYITYIKNIRECGIPVLLIYEEDLFNVMGSCYSTNVAINQYLIWAVRYLKNPASTIIRTFEEENNLYEEVIKGKNANSGDIYRRFFTAVRGRKERDDNLGEELLAICLHILSNLPAEEDGKLCMITEDKGAAGKIDTLFKNTARQYAGKKITIFSTPKLVQVLYRQAILREREHIKSILDTGADGNIVVLGALIYDIRSRDISLSSEELADLIVQPNGISIIF